MTDEKNPFINPIAEGSNVASGSKQKGKERSADIGVDIIKSLDLVIEDNEKLRVNLTSDGESLKEKLGQNNLYYMKEHERKELGKKFKGLDKTLYEQLNAKVGKIQKHGGSNFAWGAMNAIPIVSIFSGSIVMLDELNNAQVMLEKSFSVSEVKEIINELGIVAKDNKNNENLKWCKKEVEKLETKNRELWGEKNKIPDLQERLIESLKRELSLIIKPLEIEKEELDNLIRTYKKLYWAREKNNSRKIEVKEKSIGEIEKKLKNRVENEDLEKEIFRKCEEIAELKFQLKQGQKLTERLTEEQCETSDKAQIEAHPPSKE